MRSLTTLFFASLIFATLPACQTAKKRDDEKNKGLVLGTLAPNEEVSEETLSKLKEIADDPSSNLAIEEQAVEDGAFHGEVGFADAAPETVSNPAMAWKAPGLNPRSISPGDVFSDNEGPILKKSLSLADSLSEAERRQLLAQFTSAGKMQVPMTISTAELAEIKAKPEADGLKLPSRSVALDFRAVTYSTDNAKLESLFDDLSKGTSSDGITSFQFPENTGEQLAEIKERLGDGEKLFIVTGVTESSQLTASYPGAPVGKRDAEPIQNAVQQMFPHLDTLTATKQDRSIILSGSPRVLWEFEARELKLENGKLVIDSKALVQL